MQILARCIVLFLLSLFGVVNAGESCSPNTFSACNLANMIAAEHRSTIEHSLTGSRFEGGQRVESVEAKGDVLQTTIQVNRLHQELVLSLKKRNVTVSKLAEITGRSIKLDICYRLPPKAIKKKLLAYQGSIEYVIKSLDDIELFSLRLSSCAKAPAVEVYDRISSQYKKKHSEAMRWELFRGLYIYSGRGSKCSFFEEGTPYTPWGRSEQVTETWSQPNSEKWAARTGYFKNGDAISYFHFKSIEDCRGFVLDLGDKL